MSLFHFLRRGSAPMARERLKILLAHDRVDCSHPDLLGALREEILAVVGRHILFEPENVRIRLRRCKSTSHSRLTSRFRTVADSRTRPSDLIG
jgi:cell division topological specificity factor